MATTISEERRDLADVSTKCYLLDLPGELRNRIYSYAREDKPITYLSRRLERNSDESVADCGLAKGRPAFIGLTQACCQLRREYSRIYAAQVEIHVHHLDIEEFMRYGLPLLGRNEEGTPFGHLYIDCMTGNVEQETEDEDEYTEPEVDLLPLLAYHRNNPSIRILCGEHGCTCDTCQFDWSGQQNGLQELFSNATNPELQKWLDDTVCKVILQYEVEIIFIIKIGGEEDWMFSTSTSDEVSNQSSWERHMENTGFPFAFRVVRFD